MGADLLPGRRGTKRTPATAPVRGRGLLLAGVALGGIVISLAMAPGGYNPFGPVKAFALLTACALVLAAFALTPGLASRTIGRARRTRAAWAAAALVLVAVLATATAVDPAQSLLGHYPEYQGLLLLVVAAVLGTGAFALAEDERSWRVLGRTAVAVVLAVSAYALAQAAGVDPVPSLLVLTVRNVRSTLGNASNLGVFLVLALPLVLARARGERGPWRWAAWTALAAGTTVLLLSLSRGAWVGAVAAVFAWVLVEGRAWQRACLLKVLSASVAALVLAAALAALLVPNAATRALQVTDPSSGTPAWRIEVWSISARMVAARPVLGYGPGSYRYAFPAFRTVATTAGETGTQVLEDPHNVFASAAVAAGVPGLLALLALVGTAVWAAWRLDDRPGWSLGGPAMASALVGGLVALQFHFFTLDTAPLFAVIAGLAVGRARADVEPDPLGHAGESVARGTAALLTALFAGGAVLAVGLVAADFALGTGFGAVGAGTAWPGARAAFQRAEALAPWEPAMQWALGRGATQWMSGTSDAASFPDAETAMLAVGRRLSADPLVPAQTADAYLLGGLLAKDAGRLRTAVRFADRAIAADPQNGYRWATKGVALAALGDPGATDALLAAVQYAPNDGQAWATLATVYGRAGDAANAAAAQSRADAIAQSSVSTP